MSINRIQPLLDSGVSISQNKAWGLDTVNSNIPARSVNKQLLKTSGTNNLSSFQSVLCDAVLNGIADNASSAALPVNTSGSLKMTNLLAMSDYSIKKNIGFNEQNSIINETENAINIEEFSPVSNKKNIENTPIVPLDGNVLVENPGQFAETGNAEADELISRVMLYRNQTNMPAGAAIRDVASAQASLISLGYSVGSFGPFRNGVDGILGEKTSGSILAFQQNQNLKQTGTLTIETTLKLKELGKPTLDTITQAWQAELQNSPYAAADFNGTSNPFWYISFVQGNGDNPETMANIDPVFKGRLATLAKDMGCRAEFGEGYRDLERQAYLYQKYLDGTGNLAAKPGQSKHNMGLAVDTASGWLQSLDDNLPVNQQSILAQYGLYKPLANAEDTSHENWHIQPLELWNK